VIKTILKRILNTANLLRYRRIRGVVHLKRDLLSEAGIKGSGKAVLHFNAIHAYGGAAQVALSLHREMRKRSVPSSFLFENYGDEAFEAGEIPLPAKGRLDNWISAVDAISGFQGLTIGRVPESIRRAAKTENADILHLHNLHGSALSYRALPQLSRIFKIVWTLHDMQAFTGHCAYSLECRKWEEHCGECPHLDVYPRMLIDRSREMLELKKLIYEKTRTVIVCPSQWLKTDVEKSILRGQRTKLIYNGIDIDFFRPAASELERDAIKRGLGIATGKIVVLFTAAGGSGNAWKGGAFADTFRRSSGDSFAFVEIGGKKERRSSSDMSLGYVGDREELRQLYQAADILMFPTLADNCPLVVLEAMACGCAVAAFATGGVPELIDDGTTGLLAASRNYEELASGIRALLEKPNRIAQMGRNARKKVESSFSIERMVDAYLSLYEELRC
jgi:glycosyltransferase involved in cell wall biosynthesis